MKFIEILKNAPLTKLSMRNISGIYFIYNMITEKCYIGQSMHPRMRFTSHMGLLEKNKHWNDNLQKDYDKYGRWAFSFGLFENCHPDILNEREEVYYYLLDEELRYNKIPSGQTPTRKGTKLSEIHKQRIAASSRRRGQRKKMTPEEHKKAVNEGRERAMEVKKTLEKLLSETLDRTVNTNS
jgi:group I intron endonuclease